MTEPIIFDSDGVLVDSGIIALTVLARAASEEGAAIGVDEAIRSFRGLKMTACEKPSVAQVAAFETARRSATRLFAKKWPDVVVQSKRKPRGSGFPRQG